MDDRQHELLLRFFRALADETRLKIVGILATREASSAELAAALRLKPSALPRHISFLQDLGLLAEREVEGIHLYRIDWEALRLLSQEALPRPSPPATDGEEGDEWEGKVLRAFFAGQRLKEIPAAAKKRKVVLRWLAGRFENGRRYQEKEVNEILLRHHPDFASLRRELVDNLLLQRDHGVYWRSEESAS